MENNIFRQAAELLDKKHDYRLTEEERQLINTAIIPLMATKAFPEDITLREGLEELANLMEKATTKKQYERIDRFHAHLDICSQCRNHPFGLCPAGAKLLEEAAIGKIKQ